MNEVENATQSALMVYASNALAPPPAPSEEPMFTEDNVLSNEYVPTRKEALAEALEASGFIDVTGGVRANFNMLMSEPLGETVDMGDLKPGLTVELLAWVQAKLSDSPDVAQAAQANVGPQRAVRLLT